MKKTAFELEQFGKTAAKEYLQHQVPLNDTITKIASANDLNKDQINRVVEFANISTHVSLFDKQAEKYVEFETAEPAKITTDLRKQAEDAMQKLVPITPKSLQDYYDAPTNAEGISENHINIYKTAEKDLDMGEGAEAPVAPSHMDGGESEGTPYAGLAPAQQIALKKQLEQIKMRQEQNKDKSILLDAQYKTAQTKLAQAIRQEILENGTSFYDIVHAVHTKYASVAVDQALMDSKESLPKNTSFEKTANVHYSTEDNHPILKIAAEINQVFAEYTENYNERLELEKQAKVNTWLKATGLALGGAALITTGAIANENHRQQTQSYLKDIPMEYQR